MNAHQLLADPIRFRIVEILASGEHMSGNISEAITASYGVSRAAVSKHLAILRTHGWVDYHADASARWYHLTDDVWAKMNADARWLEYLWARRTGHLSKTDPLALHTEEPFSGATDR